MRYVRTNIYLTSQQKAGLKQSAQKQGVKPAELIRRIVDAFLHKEVRRAG